LNNMRLDFFQVNYGLVRYNFNRKAVIIQPGVCEDF